MQVKSHFLGAVSCVVVATLLCVPASAQQATSTILSHDFKSNPAKAGWQLLQFSWVEQSAKGGWLSDAQAPHAHSLSVENGYWQSPQFASVPHQYYRLTFRSKAQNTAYWAAVSSDAKGKTLQADHYSAISKSEDWVENEFYFQGKADSVSARLLFQPTSPKDGKSIYLRDVKLSKATDKQVLDWADRVYAAMQPVEYESSPQRWSLIPRTMEKLASGEKLKIVILGDSIGNDTGNSPVDKLIQRLYPGSKVEIVTSVRGATGCWYYQHENRVHEYVTRYQPDLVMMIGISRKYDPESLRSVIHQIRKQCDTEILLATGPVAQDQVMIRHLAKGRKISIEEATAIRKNFLTDIARLATEEKVEFIPLRKLWNEHMKTVSREHDVSWFMRDITHANVRGRQVVARLLEQYFVPSGNNSGR